MYRFRYHIAYFLLGGFLFPQIANAVHYMVQSHSFSPYTGDTYDYAVPPYDYHVCDYQFNGFNSFIIAYDEFKPSLPAAREKEVKFFNTFKFVNELAFHYSLRGPPRAGR